MTGTPQGKLPRRPAAFVVGMAPWKQFVPLWLSGYDVKYIPGKVSPLLFWLWSAPQMLMWPEAPVFIWGFKCPDHVERFIRKRRMSVVRVEDGFLRSIDLGASKQPPLSICFDHTGIYYDATAPSDLENLIQTYDFASDQKLMHRARTGLEDLISSGLSKYNASREQHSQDLYGVKSRRRVLVLGQVDEDMSIIKGCERRIASADLVHLAVRENPDAQVIYKPHPEILRRNKADPMGSAFKDVSDLALVIEKDVALADALNSIDHVYTITSLSGFEALLRGIEVTCLGMPFYAGWGLTDDRQICPRRTAKRTVLELFGASYLKYPKYFDYENGAECTFEEALEQLKKLKSSQIKQHEPTGG